jgi:phospholipid/cholesterol/gamma-HCH transport system substrate-binding protein
MYKHTTNKIKLGVFVSLGIAVFIFGIYFIGERQQLFRSTFRLIGVFRDVGGLQAGNNVRLSGITVGTVANIDVVSDSSVKVEILVDEGTRKFIKKDAIASIGSEGLMGNKILIITPGTGGKKIIENNDTVKTSVPLSLDDIMASVKTTVDYASSITRDLSKVTGDIEAGKGTIGKLLMNQSLAQNIDTTLANLKEGSADLKKGLSGLKLLVDDAHSSFTQNFDSTFVNLKEGSVHLKQGLSGLQSLVDDTRSSFGQHFDSTFVNLKEASAELRILLDKAKHSWLLWGF